MSLIGTMLIAQGLAGGLQLAFGAARKRQKIDTSMAPEFAQNEQTAKNLSQSTSESFDIARRTQAQAGASAMSAAQRGAQTPGGFARMMVANQRQQGSASVNLFATELQQRRQNLMTLMNAKSQTASERNRIQALKNQIAFNENASRDRLISAGMQNIFGAASGGINNAQFDKQMELYGQMYGTQAGKVNNGGIQPTLLPPINTNLNVIRRPNFG